MFVYWLRKQRSMAPNVSDKKTIFLPSELQNFNTRLSHQFAECIDLLLCRRPGFRKFVFMIGDGVP